MVAVGGLAVACGGRAPEPVAPSDLGPKPPSMVSVPRAEQLAGLYSFEHEVQMVCDEDTPGAEEGGWCPQEVTDVLKIRAAEAGAIEVDLEMWFTNGHSCTFQNTMTPAGEGRWNYKDDPNAGLPCDFTLSVEGDDIVLASEECRDYCGMRGVLEGSFARASQKPLLPD